MKAYNTFNAKKISPIIENLYNNLAKPLCTVRSVQSLSPPKPAGLDPPNFRRHAPNWTWNHDSPKKI
jgi:hypothetical protein